MSVFTFNSAVLALARIEASLKDFDQLAFLFPSGVYPWEQPVPEEATGPRVTFESLCRAHGMTLSQAAVASGADPLLFLRIQQQQQPLPADLVTALALVLGEQEGTVQQAAAQWCANTPAAHNAIPQHSEFLRPVVGPIQV